MNRLVLSSLLLVLFMALAAGRGRPAGRSKFSAENVNELRSRFGRTQNDGTVAGGKEPIQSAADVAQALHSFGRPLLNSRKTAGAGETADAGEAIQSFGARAQNPQVFGGRRPNPVISDGETAGAGEAAAAGEAEQQCERRPNPRLFAAVKDVMEKLLTACDEEDNGGGTPFLDACEPATALRAKIEEHRAKSEAGDRPAPPDRPDGPPIGESEGEGAPPVVRPPPAADDE